MHRELAYSYRKLMEAVQAMAIGPDSLQLRLEYALNSFRALRAQDFPALLESRYQGIVDRLNALAGGNGGDWGTAKLAQLSDHDARQVARLIYELFLDVALIHGRGGPRRSAPQGK